MSDKYLWLAVTADEYELPLAVTDSPTELAKIFGVSKNTIKSQARRNSGTNNSKKFMKVRNYDEQSED